MTRAIRKPSLWQILALAAVLAIAAASPAATIQIIYGDAPGTGFYDPSLGPDRQEAFRRAVDAYATTLGGDVAVTVRAEFHHLGGTAYRATLGFGGPERYFRDLPDARPGTWYPSALADQLAGKDIAPGQADLHVTFNADLDGEALGEAGYHYGLEPPGGEDVDFQTIAMHELGHGLGIYGSFEADGTFGLDGLPTIFDALLENADGQKLIDLPTEATNVVSPVYFAGLHAEAVRQTIDDQDAVDVYAPRRFVAGSSLAHLDEITFRGEWGLMTPQYDTALRNVDMLTLGVMADLGWDVLVPLPNHAPEPATSGLILAGGLLLLVRRQRRACTESR